jgi:hypothetical protein
MCVIPVLSAQTHQQNYHPYTTLYYGDFKMLHVRLCKTPIIRLRITEVHNEEGNDHGFLIMYLQEQSLQENFLMCKWQKIHVYRGCILLFLLLLLLLLLLRLSRMHDTPFNCKYVVSVTRRFKLS